MSGRQTRGTPAMWSPATRICIPGCATPSWQESGRHRGNRPPAAEGGALSANRAVFGEGGMVDENRVVLVTGAQQGIGAAMAAAFAAAGYDVAINWLDDLAAAEAVA